MRATSAPTTPGCAQCLFWQCLQRYTSLFTVSEHYRRHWSHRHGTCSRFSCAHTHFACAPLSMPQALREWGIRCLSALSRVPDCMVRKLMQAPGRPAQVLSLMLEQTGLHLAAFPDAPFRLANWTMRGHHCILDKTPDRMLDIQVRLPPLSWCSSKPHAAEEHLLVTCKCRFVWKRSGFTCAHTCHPTPHSIIVLVPTCVNQHTAPLMRS